MRYSFHEGVTKMTNEEKRVLRMKQVKDYKASGLSLNQWCQQNNIKPSAIRYWVELDNKSSSSFSQESSNSVKWFQVKGVDLGGYQSSKISLSLGSVSINIEDDFDPGMLRKVIIAIKDIC